jgi:hypothetical protein
LKEILNMPTTSTPFTTSRLERVIDELVYALNGLTAEEIKTVEDSTT